MGTLGDRIGRRRLLLIGATAFGAASIVAAFSSSPEMLIASRAVLGIAGATLAPSTLALIRSMFEDDRQRTVAIGIWIASFSAGAAVGPLVGGVLLESFHWGSVFLWPCRSWRCCSRSARGSCPSTRTPTPAASTWPAPRCRCSPSWP
jgi:DHA2 family multidrug resistance protein-like MFS transporter